MKVLISGGTGLIGRALAAELKKIGAEPILLTRGHGQVPPGESSVTWDARGPGPWEQALEQADAVVNLAGESVAEGRWTQAKKRRILESRLQATRALVDAMGRARRKPAVLISASAVGYYGIAPQGDSLESSPRGDGFLAEVCAAWEEEARRAEAYGTRVVLARIGVVLAAEGGALPRMALPFRFFLGGHLGSGKQWFPWIHREDVAGIILHALRSPRVRGPVNATAPNPARLKDFCRTLGRVLKRPSWAHVPAFALRLGLGEMADMLLGGQRALPAAIQAADYRFRHPDLEEALRDIFQRAPERPSRD